MKQFGRYKIEKQIGAGGMGKVYLGRDPQIGRYVAIKVLAPQLTYNREFRKRFQSEANIAARLEGYPIVPIYDFGQEQDQLFIVMQYMPGGTLAQKMNRQKLLTTDQVNSIMYRICHALDAAHQRNIVHRDIKPGNILFDNEGQAYLADFGIARITQANKKFSTGHIRKLCIQ